MGLQAGLDLGGGDILARTTDDVFLTVDEIQHAVVRLLHHVAGMEPPIGPGFLRGLVVFQIAREKAAARVGGRMAHQQFTLLPARQLAAVVAGHHGLEARQRPAEGARVDLTRLVAVGKNAAGLGHAPDLDQRKTETVLEGLVQLRLNAGTEAKAHAMAFLVLRHRLVEQQRRHHAEIVDDGGARLGHFLPPTVRAETLGQDQAIGGQHGAGGRHRAMVHVEQRQRVVETVLAVFHRQQATEIAIPGAGSQRIEIGQHAALGPAGGAGGVEQVAFGVVTGQSGLRLQDR